MQVNDTLYQLDPGRPCTGRSDTIMLSCKEDLSILLFNCSFDGGEAIDLNSEINKVMVPSIARVMEIRFLLQDEGGHTIEFSRGYPVTDVIAPTVVVHPGTPYCGRTFYIEPIYNDNIAVALHGIAFDQGWGPTSIMDDDSPAMISIRTDAIELDISIWAQDLSGNIGYNNMTLKVIDGIPPSIVSVDPETVDGLVHILVRATDNRASEGLNCSVEFTSSGERVPMLMKMDEYELWTAYPAGTTNLTFVIVATDGSGNTATSGPLWIEIRPSQEAEDGGHGLNDLIWPAIVIIALLLVSSMAAIYLRSKRRHLLGPEE